MSSKITSIIVANLQTNDPWANQVNVTCYTDAGLTNEIAGKSCPLIRDAAGGPAKQKDALIFDGLSVGTTYWFAARTVITATNAASAPQTFALVAGNGVPPNVAYAIAVTITPSGTHCIVTPVSYPTDVDHYDWYAATNGNPPTASTHPHGSQVIDASGTFNFYAGGASAQWIWVRAVNTTGIAQAWVNAADQTIPNEMKVLVRSQGQYATAYPSAGIWINDVAVRYSDSTLAKRGYNICCISRTSYAVTAFVNYDPGDTASDAAAMYNFLAPRSNEIIIIFVYLEGANNRLINASLPGQLYFIGASRQVFASPNFRTCSAYLLVGQNNPVAGNGNAIELYAGQVDLDPNAFCETTFYINNGSVLGYNGTYPAASQIDPTKGDISARGSLAPSLGTAFGYTSGPNQIQWNYNNQPVFRSDLNHSVAFYTGVLLNQGLSVSTNYWFFPYIDDDLSSPSYSLLEFVNNGEVGGGIGNPGCAYTSLNYFCVQYCQALNHLPLTPGGLKAATTAAGGSGGGSSGGSGTCLWDKTIVLEKDKGYIELSEVRPGDLLDAPDGWAEVKDITFSPDDLWVGTTFAQCADEFLSTPGHTWETFDGEEKQSAKLTIEDAIPTKTGITFPESIRIVRKPGTKTRVTLNSERKLFYIGILGVQTHNIADLPC